MKSSSKICLLIGLILSMVLFVYYTVSSFIGMMAVFGMMGTGDPVFETAGMITIGMIVLMAVFGILGIIFTGISFTRLKMDAQTFANKKGMPITVAVFNFILGFLILIGLFEGVDVLSVICLIGFIASAVLIIVAIVLNKKEMNAPQVSQVAEVKAESKEEKQEKNK